MRTLNSYVLALVLAFAVPVLAHAQANPDARPAPVPAADRGDDRDWGWLGLLGLAGLTGLWRRDRDYTRDRLSTGTPR
jgi:hypothetical protein